MQASEQDNTQPQRSIYRSERFENKTFLVTGGAGGIGLAAAERLLSEGGRVALVDIKPDALSSALQKLLDAGFRGDRILTITADVSNQGDVVRYVGRTVSEWGTIDGFFNNAAMDGPQKPIDEYDVDLFQKVTTVSLSGAYLGLQHVLPQMRAQGFGRVVNTASIGGLRGWGRHYGYIASKHGVVGLTKAAAVEMGPAGITVNAIAPGGVRTEMAVEAMKRLNPEDPAAAEAQFCAGVPLGRMAKPSEIAGAVAFLFSDDAAFINGHVLTIDGGQTVK